MRYPNKSIEHIKMNNTIRASENIFFEPYIGNYYLDGINRSKVMILGLCHWCGKKDCKHCCCQLGGTRAKYDLLSDSTFNYKSCIEWTSYEIANHEMNKTYCNFEKRLSKICLDVWNHVAFYNLIQSAPLNSSSNSVSSELYENSKKSFLEVLDILKPNKVITWGWGTWGNLPCEGWFDKGQIEGVPYGSYDMFDWSLDIIRVIHPSPKSNYRVPENETDLLLEFLSR